MITVARMRSKITNNLRLASEKDASPTALYGFIADAVMELRNHSNIMFEVSVPLVAGQKYYDVDGKYDIIVSAEFPWTTASAMEWVERDTLIDLQAETVTGVYYWSHWREIVVVDEVETDVLRIGFSDYNDIGTGTVKLHCTIGEYAEFTQSIPLPRSMELLLQFRATANAAYVYRKDEIGLWENRYEAEFSKWKINHLATQHRTPLKTDARYFTT